MEKVGSKFENHCFKEQVRLLGFVLNLLQSCFLFPFLFFFFQTCFLKLNISYHNLGFAFHLPCKSCYSNSSKMNQMRNLLRFFCREQELVFLPLTWSCLLLAPCASSSFLGDFLILGSDRIFSAMQGLGPIVNKPHSATKEVTYRQGGKEIMSQQQMSVS